MLLEGTAKEGTTREVTARLVMAEWSRPFPTFGKNQVAVRQNNMLLEG